MKKKAVVKKVGNIKKPFPMKKASMQAPTAPVGGPPMMCKGGKVKKKK